MPKAPLYIVAVIVSVAIIALVGRLAFVQSAAGTAYPPYSSLRADAEGLKAFYDVAEAVGRKPERSFISTAELRVTNTTIVKLGVSAGSLAASAASTVNNPALLASLGNSVLLGVTGTCRYTEIPQWKLKMACGDGSRFFEVADWAVVEADSEGRPRVVERRFGKGEIVLVADSRLLNNASLARGSRGDLLAKLIERRPALLFDEEHLGVADQVSVAALIWRYRLHGVLAAAVLLFGLFVWKNATSFLPVVSEHAAAVRGQDTTAGLSNLLRRSVPETALLSTAISEWGKVVKNPSKREEISRLAATGSSPADAYNAIAYALRRDRIGR